MTQRHETMHRDTVPIIGSRISRVAVEAVKKMSSEEEDDDHIMLPPDTSQNNALNRRQLQIASLVVETRAEVLSRLEVMNRRCRIAKRPVELSVSEQSDRRQKVGGQEESCSSLDDRRPCFAEARPVHVVAGSSLESLSSNGTAPECFGGMTNIRSQGAWLEHNSRRPFGGKTPLLQSPNSTAVTAFFAEQASTTTTTATTTTTTATTTSLPPRADGASAHLEKEADGTITKEIEELNCDVVARDDDDDDDDNDGGAELVLILASPFLADLRDVSALLRSSKGLRRHVPCSVSTVDLSGRFTTQTRKPPASASSTGARRLDMLTALHQSRPLLFPRAQTRLMGGGGGGGGGDGAPTTAPAKVVGEGEEEEHQQQQQRKEEEGGEEEEEEEVSSEGASMQTSVSYCDLGVTDEAVVKACAAFPAASTLDFSHCREVTNASLQAVRSSMAARACLTALDLSGTRCFDLAALLHEELDGGGKQNKGSGRVASNGNGCESGDDVGREVESAPPFQGGPLPVVRTHYYSLLRPSSPRVLSAFSAAPALPACLTSLSLRSTAVADLHPLAALSHSLKHLSLSGCRSLRNALPIGLLRSLESLDLEGTSVEQASLDGSVFAVGTCERLKDLNLANCSQVYSLRALLLQPSLDDNPLLHATARDDGVTSLPRGTHSTVSTLSPFGCHRVSSDDEVGGGSSGDDDDGDDDDGPCTLPLLTTLNLKGTAVASLDGLANCSFLESLDLEGCPVQSLQALAHAAGRNLTHLNAANCPALHTDPHGSLLGICNSTNLVALDLQGSRLPGLPDMSGHTRLRTLNMSDTRITSLECLRCCTRLTDLNLCDSVELADVSALQGTQRPLFQRVPSPLALDGDVSYVEDECTAEDLVELGYGFSFFTGFTELHTLNLGGCRKLESIASLSLCPSLHTLSLYSTKVRDISPLGAGNCPLLVNLLLYLTPVADLGPLANCPLLEMLNLTACRNVSCVGALANCPYLASLELNSTAVSDLAPLRDCGRLKTLSLDSAFELASLDGAFEPCPRPRGCCDWEEEEEEEENEGADYQHSSSSLGMPTGQGSPLSRSLKLLDLDGSGVSNVSDLRHCQNLAVLSLKRTQIKDVSPLGHGCVSLHTLGLAYTLVSNVDEVVAGCPRLTTLNLSGSQVSVYDNINLNI